MNIFDFQKNMGYIFKDQTLITSALTHTSYAHEHNTESYERLEFLGDAIVDFLVGEYLFKKFPHLSEGDMSRIRSFLVCEKALGSLAEKIGIGNCMLLGNGAEQSGDRNRVSILSDMFEAHIAALYLDAGFEKTRDYFFSLYQSEIDRTAAEDVTDYKTSLQERLQQNGSCIIEYKLIHEDGPVHDCIFTFEVFHNGSPLGTGSGKSKKAAQQNAACNALKKINSGK